jgi:hypothetical protein
MAISDQERAAITDWLGGNLKRNFGGGAGGKTRHGPRPARWSRWPWASEACWQTCSIRICAILWNNSSCSNGPCVRGRPKVNDRRVAAVVWHRIKAGDQRQAAYQHAVEALGVYYSTAEKSLARREKHFGALADWAPESSLFKRLTRTTDP